MRKLLGARGIAVLAQGIDGTPAQLVARFQADPKAVLLGTSSFWEGVDLCVGQWVEFEAVRAPTMLQAPHKEDVLATSRPSACTQLLDALSW